MKKIDITALAAKCRKPPIQRKASVFWRDPYISAHILHAHLDPDSEAGSRKPERIEQEAATVIDALDIDRLDTANTRPFVLDLGCGPGLYSREFLRRGFSVHGMDFSPASVDHARKICRTLSKKKSDLHAQFTLCDFTKVPYRAQASGAALIYGIFGNLCEKDRDNVLHRLHEALRPGARFVFAVFSEASARREALKGEWYFAQKDGFWRPQPHLVLERSWFYENDQTIFNTYYVIGEDGAVETNIVRHRWYTEDELPVILKKHGFKTISMSHPFEEDWLTVVAEKAVE